jgi:hypothetical protein
MSGILGAYQLEFIIRKDPTFVLKDMFSAHTQYKCVYLIILIKLKALLGSQKNILNVLNILLAMKLYFKRAILL